MNRKSKVLFCISILASLWFLNSFALPYLTEEIGVLGIYWPHRSWLHVHIGTGSVALLLGPALLWVRLERMSRIGQQLALITYLMAAAISGVTALYLAFHTGFGFVIALGFTSMAIAGLIAIVFTAIAAIRHLDEQYREWLIRSYVLTFAFVLYRFGCELFNFWGHGTFLEQMSAACWLSWSIPMVITEAFLQGRKVLAPSTKAHPKESWVTIASQLQDFN